LKATRSIEPRSGSGGERGEDLGKGHPGLRHQCVLLGGIGIDGAEIGPEQDLSSGGEPQPQLIDARLHHPLLDGQAVVAQERFPEHQRGRERSAPLPHCGQQRFVPRAEVRRGVSDDVHSGAQRQQHVGAAGWMREGRSSRPMGRLHRRLDSAFRERA
jgi:hypothetical protein